MVQDFNMFAVFNRFEDSIGSKVQLVRRFNWFEGSIGLKVQLDQGFNLLKVSIGSSFQTVQFVQGFN